ncbi:hypothetical protein [Brevundimonas sp. Root1423]|uniref:hypothetical protein n=1 Tax=Brevundimonas sp. Root1423 TaxID=1736462 RepID=UPI0006FBBC6E|nr:hypothetical protein [Brevundimonas sp. Root1423]KQY96360.1 hypothetical protein ASD25_00230 [Brevundimonas sp. Root1423]
MQALIEFIAGFVAILAAAALSQFGLNLDPPQKSEREIHRVRDCDNAAASAVVFAASSERKQDC